MINNTNLIQLQDEMMVVLINGIGMAYPPIFPPLDGNNMPKSKGVTGDTVPIVVLAYHRRRHL